MSEIPKPPKIINPLWIIFLFFSFTEIALGYVVFNTGGYVQLALTIFVIGFPLIIAIGFFLLVWSKPQHLYAPKDFTSDASFLKGISESRRSGSERYGLGDEVSHRILSGVSSKHMINDLNNAVSGLVSYPELLLMDLAEDNPLRKRVETILDVGKEAAAIVQDLLTLVRAEEEKEELQAQLQGPQRMEAIGTLAGGVAHDLNSILSGLVSYPELLLLEIPEDSPLRNPILTIQKSGQKAADIVQDLLTLARRGVAVAEVVSLNHIISEYMKSPEHKKLKSFHPNVQSKTKLDRNLLNILGSPVHLSKTIMNLVSNAVEAMPDGGKVTISTKNRYIDRPIGGYEHVEEGDYVMLTVSDTGGGISSKDIEKIFEPFYTKKVMGRSGTGLGLAVVWGTVKDHKGYIDVKSTEGKGSKFTLYFPVSREELAKERPSLRIEDYIGKGESVLVVDDVQEQREIASEILKRLGYSATSVSSGEEAVDYLKDNSADLLVLDMIMDPGIDGLDTYKQILEMHPKQKAIIVSGFSETKRVKEAQRLGAGAYLKKPFLLEKIGPAVRNELGG